MPPRVYAPVLTPHTTSMELPDGEADHLARVLRVRRGDALRVFNGHGLEREATVIRVAKHAVAVELGKAVSAAEECRVRVTLAQALLKGDKLDDLVRDATMMGVAAIHPILTARTDVPAAAFGKAGRVERWQRIAVSSVKQCGRAVVPDVEEPVPFADCLERDHSDLRILLSEPAVGHGPGLEPLRATAGVSSALVLVGPEGGWAPEEVEAAARAGAIAVTLGRRTLRADATALVALSILLYIWGDL